MFQIKWSSVLRCSCVGVELLKSDLRWMEQEINPDSYENTLVNLQEINSHAWPALESGGMKGISLSPVVASCLVLCTGEFSHNDGGRPGSDSSLSFPAASNHLRFTGACLPAKMEEALIVSCKHSRTHLCTWAILSLTHSKWNILLSRAKWLQIYKFGTCTYAKCTVHVTCLLVLLPHFWDLYLTLYFTCFAGLFVIY